jgi:hypothetical protein
MKTYSIHECAPIYKGIHSQFIQATTSISFAGAIDSDFKEFQHYSSGVFNGECGESVDYGVLVVGFDKTTS